MALHLRARFSAARPGYHPNKRHWNTVDMDGSVEEAELREMIDHSYDLVVKRLPQAERARVSAGDRLSHRDGLVEADALGQTLAACLHFRQLLATSQQQFKLGAAVAPLSGGGLLVGLVRPVSAAAQAGLSSGDVNQIDRSAAVTKSS